MIAAGLLEGKAVGVDAVAGVEGHVLGALVEVSRVDDVAHPDSTPDAVAHPPAVDAAEGGAVGDVGEGGHIVEAQPQRRVEPLAVDDQPPRALAVAGDSAVQCRHEFRPLGTGADETHVAA